MSPPRKQHQVIILCPLEVERRAVIRALSAAGLHNGTRVVRSGLGAAATAAAVASIDRQPRLVVLAGLCGGLARDFDGVALVRRVVTPGESAAPPEAWDSPVTDHTAITLVGVDHLVCTAEDKRRLHERTGAAAVDMESHAFARACAAWRGDAAKGDGLRWAIVRSVSDGWDEAIPAEAIGWLHPDGRTVTRRIIWDLARRPRLIGMARRLGRRTRAALGALGERTATLVSEESAKSPASRG